jgi:hypothetical protein
MNKPPMLMPSALLIAGGIAVLVMATSLMVPAQPVWADLPPRPTPGEWRGEELEKTTIELRVRFEDAQQAARWQELWTVVEWQDAFGDWHEVEGWRGALDEVVRGEGRKVWWVSLDDLGKGPFRWTVCRRPAGRPLAHSKPFHLPGTGEERVVVGVALGP